MQQECEPDCLPCDPKGCCISRLKQEFAERRIGRLTRERISLLRSVCKIEGHFDADQVVSQLDSDAVAVSQATVYRTLPLLEQAGIIRRVGLDRPNEKTVYEHVWGRQHHDHLLCSACGAVVEFTDPAIEVLQEAVARRHGFTLHTHHLDLVGLCSKCSSRRKGSG